MLGVRKLALSRVKAMKKLLCLIALVGAIFAPTFAFIGTESAFAQAQPVITRPYNATTNNASSTIASTNTFQSIWAADTTTVGRTSCTIQNNGTHTMYVFFGPIASATTSNSVQLQAGQVVYCSINGVILRDQVSITGTSGDAFYAARQ